MRSDGSARGPKHFRLTYLSSGEISLCEHLQLVGRQTKGGHEIRFIDVTADAGAGMDVFRDLHGFSDPRSLAEHLERATRRFYGTAIREFLRLLLAPENLLEATRHCHVEAARLQSVWQVPPTSPARVQEYFIPSCGGRVGHTLGYLAFPYRARGGMLRNHLPTMAARSRWVRVRRYPSSPGTNGGITPPVRFLSLLSRPV